MTPNNLPPLDSELPDDLEAVPPAFTARLQHAAPVVDDTFRRRLAGQLQREFASTQRRKPRLSRFPSRASLRVTLVAAILLVVAGAAVAVNSLVQQWIMGDPGLKSVYEAGKGVPLNLKQTIDGYTVTLEWAYADKNRITIAYTIAGRPGVQYTNLDSQNSSLTTADGSTEFDLTYGEGNALNTSTAQSGSIPTGTISGNQRVFDIGPASLNQDVLNLRFQLEIYGVTVLKRTEIPTLEPWEALQESPSQPFVFTFSLPLNGSLRLLAAPVTATDQGIMLTLEKVTVAPSQTTVTVCFDAPTLTHSWTSIPRLSAGEPVPGGGAVVSTRAGETRHCDEFTYNAALYDYKGEWQLEITELVGFPASGHDQQRIKGSWVFDFTVP